MVLPNFLVFILWRRMYKPHREKPFIAICEHPYKYPYCNLLHHTLDFHIYQDSHYYLPPCLDCDRNSHRFLEFAHINPNPLLLSRECSACHRNIFQGIGPFI